jgi:hypothetical protein
VSRKSFSLRALDVAAAGVMLSALNGPSVLARGIAVAQGNAKVGDQLPGMVSDVYQGAKKNWVLLAAVPAGLALYRANVPSKSVKVHVLPLRVGA